MFHILIGVVVTQVHMFVKTHHVVQLKSLHFTDCKCAKRSKQKKTLMSYKPYFAQKRSDNLPRFIVGVWKSVLCSENCNFIF